EVRAEARLRWWPQRGPPPQLVTSFVANRRAASRKNTVPNSVADSAPDAIRVHSTSVAIRSIHANEKCVGRKSRRSPSAVIWSRICDRIDTSTAPPTAPSGASVETLSTIARDRKSTRLNSSHVKISYAVFCLKKKKDRERLH